MEASGDEVTREFQAVGWNAVNSHSWRTCHRSKSFAHHCGLTGGSDWVAEDG